MASGGGVKRKLILTWCGRLCWVVCSCACRGRYLVPTRILSCLFIVLGTSCPLVSILFCFSRAALALKLWAKLVQAEALMLQTLLSVSSGANKDTLAACEAVYETLELCLPPSQNKAALRDEIAFKLAATAEVAQAVSARPYFCCCFCPPRGGSFSPLPDQLGVLVLFTQNVVLLPLSQEGQTCS